MPYGCLGIDHCDRPKKMVAFDSKIFYATINERFLHPFKATKCHSLNYPIPNGTFPMNDDLVDADLFKAVSSHNKVDC